MPLSLKLLGEFELRDERGTALSLPTRKTRALLGYLAVNADRPQPRERLMALLWSDRGERQARQSLNQALLSIRRLADGDGVKLLDGDLEHVTLNSDALESDVARFRALLAEEPAEAVKLYEGPFLDGLLVPDPAFEEWLTATRSELHSAICDGLRRAAEAAAEAGNSDEAIAMAQRLVSLDPLQEDAYRRLMRYLYDAGDRVGALRQYQACADVLQKELQVEPDGATKALFEEIRQDTLIPETAETPAPKQMQPFAKTKPKDASNRRWLIPAIAACIVLVVGAVVLFTGDWFTSRTKPVASVAEHVPMAQYCATLDNLPSVAVLPFANLSDDSKQEYLSDGISEDIITRLSARPDMIVAARTSSFAYKGKPSKVKEIGRELRVGYVLEGSVQKAGNRIRITAQLIDAKTGNHLWSGRYDREIKDLFVVQDEIAHKVAVELAVKLTKGELARVNYRSTNNVTAYEFYLRGMREFDTWRPQAHERARKLFEKAIEHDPRYARAIARLGWIYMVRRMMGIWNYDPDKSINRAEELATQALAIDENSSIVHSLLGWLYAYRGHYEKAIAEGKRAIAMEPNNPWHYNDLARIMLYAGRLQEATDLVVQAMCLSPVPPNLLLSAEALTHYLSGRYEAAISSCRRLLARSTQIGSSHSCRRRIVASYMALGREAEARAEAKIYLDYYLQWRGRPYRLKKRINGMKNRPYKDPSWIDVFADRLRKAGFKD